MSELDKVVLLEEPVVKHELINTNYAYGYSYTPGRASIPPIKMRLPERILRKFQTNEYKHYGPEMCTYNGKKYLIYGICSPLMIYNNSVLGQVKYYKEGIKCYVDYFETY